MTDEDMVDAMFKAFAQVKASGAEEPSWAFTDRPKEAEAAGLKVYYPGTPEYDAIFNDTSAETSSYCVMRGPRE